MLRRARVKVLCCRNLMALVTEESLRDMFERYGRVEEVKKIKDFAFVHFEKREELLLVLNICLKPSWRYHWKSLLQTRGKRKC